MTTHVKINAGTLHAIRAVLQTALDHPEPFTFDDETEQANHEFDIEQVERFLSVDIPHGPTTWHLVDQATANNYIPLPYTSPSKRELYRHSTLGSATPGRHV